MAVATAPVQTPFRKQNGSDGRVYLRHQCDVPTTCQPVAARGPDEPHWEARIRNISAVGVGLSVVRRFERGTGLAIEIPEEGDFLGDTLLVRVIHVVALPTGGWLLGCGFISTLSEDTVARLAQLSQSQEDAAQAKSDAETANVVADVIWQDRETGKRQRIRRLVTSAWPLTPKTVLNLWMKDAAGERRPTALVVHSCRKNGEGWIVDYSIQALSTPRPSRYLQRG